MGTQPVIAFAVFLPLSLVCRPSQLPTAAAHNLVREPVRVEAAVHGGQVLDCPGGHRGAALPGRRLLGHAL